MARAPNVVVVMADQMKATASGVWGNRFCRTPNLERLAARGVVYDAAYTPHPLCVPARIAFWTARWPHETGARTNQDAMPEGAAHAIRLWKEAGWRVGLIGKDHCFRRGDDRELFDVWCEISHYGFENGDDTTGMDWWRAPEAVRAAHAARVAMEDRERETPGVVHAETFSYAVTDYPEDDYGTGLVTGQVERFLETHGDEPFALWVSYPDPHTPYEAPRRLFDALIDRVELPPWRLDAFARGPERLRVLHAMMDVSRAPLAELRALLACYHAMVAFIDEGVGRILDALERAGLAENTIVVFCSDHGDFAGEHMMMAKGGAFFDCLTRVPLIVADPRGPRGRRASSPVNLIDVVPTLLDLQGLAVPGIMDGARLPVLAEGGRRDATFSAYGAGGPRFTLADLYGQGARRGRAAVAESLRRREREGRRMMVRTERWKYVHDPAGDLDELYDMANDPGELFDLAGDPETAALRTGLRDRLSRWNPRALDLAA